MGIPSLESQSLESSARDLVSLLIFVVFLMASLRNLFGSSSSAADSNDALKFVAPKEKSVKQQSVAQVAAPVVSATATPAK